MRLGNFTRAVLAAGAIPLSAQSVHLQGLERLVEQTQVHVKQTETTAYKSLFLKLYEKIEQFEFGIPQNNDESRIYRSQMFESLEGDINKLLLEYGIDLAADEPFFNGVVFGTRYGFVVGVVNAAKFNAEMTFRNDGSVMIEYMDATDTPNLEGYFIRLKPTKAKPRPLTEVLVNESQKDIGLHYFARDDFDTAYRIIRELTEEYARIDRQDYLRTSLIRRQIQDIRDDLLTIHEIPQQRYYSEIDARAGRILIPVRGSNYGEPDRILVIWPNRVPTLTMIYKDETFTVTPLTQVMKSNR